MEVLQLNTKFLVKSALVAAIYVVVTMACYPFAYGAVQFRLSELLALLAFLDPGYILGLGAGCFIANLLGVGGITDAIFGTLHSVVYLLIIVFMAKKVKNQTLGLFLASLAPALTSFIVAFEMVFILGDTSFGFWLWYGFVALGEFVVVTVAGFPLYKFILSKPAWVSALRRIRN